MNVITAKENVVSICEARRKPTYHQSFIYGWNSVNAGLMSYDDDFNPDQYLAGVTAAVQEWKQVTAERATALKAANEDIELVKEAILRLNKVGIFIDTQSDDDSLFVTSRGIRMIEIDEDNHDGAVPF